MNGPYVLCHGKFLPNKRVHLCVCQTRCPAYPCKEAEELEIQLMEAGKPFKFGKEEDDNRALNCKTS